MFVHRPISLTNFSSLHTIYLASFLDFGVSSHGGTTTTTTTDLILTFTSSIRTLPDLTSILPPSLETLIITVWMFNRQCEVSDKEYKIYWDGFDKEISGDYSSPSDSSSTVGTPQALTTTAAAALIADAQDLTATANTGPRFPHLKTLGFIAERIIRGGREEKGAEFEVFGRFMRGVAMPRCERKGVLGIWGQLPEQFTVGPEA
jgi:hypothetical protein